MHIVYCHAPYAMQCISYGRPKRVMSSTLTLCCLSCGLVLYEGSNPRGVPHSENKILRKWIKPAVAGSWTQDTSGLSRQWSATEPQQPATTSPNNFMCYTGGTEYFSRTPAATLHVPSQFRVVGLRLLWLSGWQKCPVFDSQFSTQCISKLCMRHAPQEIFLK